MNSRTTPSNGSRYTPYPRPRQPPAQPGPYVFDFGKHIGRTLEEVVRWYGDSYIEILKRENIARNNPDLKAALASYRHVSPYFERLQEDGFVHADEEEEYIPDPQPTGPYGGPYLEDYTPEEPPSYCFTFGRYQGRTLQEIDKLPGGNHYIADLISTGVPSRYPDLQESLNRFRTVYKQKVYGGWQAPDLSLAPAKFHHSQKGPIWLYCHDAHKYFGQSAEVTEFLPWVDFIDGSGERISSHIDNPLHWLFHVWALARIRTSAQEADAGLERFLSDKRQEERRVQAGREEREGAARARNRQRRRDPVQRTTVRNGLIETPVGETSINPIELDWL